MTLSGLIDELKLTDNACETYIGEEQLSQIKALNMQVTSLKNTLNTKNETIEVYKKMEEQISNHVLMAASHISQTFSDNLEITNFVNDLGGSFPLEDKVGELFNFFLNLVDSYEDQLRNTNIPKVQAQPQQNIKNTKEDQDRNNAEIERLRAQLQGHIDLLVRLTEMPEHGHLFLIDNKTGDTFLREATKDILREQCRQTTLLLHDIQPKSSPKKSNQYSIVSCVDPRVNMEDRINNIDRILDNEDLNKNELRDIIIQEATVTSMLANHIKYLQEELKESQTLKPQRSVDLGPKAPHVFQMLCSALDDINTKYTPNNLLYAAEKLADDVIAGKKKAGLETGGFEDYVDQTAQSLRMMKNMMVTAQHQLQQTSSGNPNIQRDLRDWDEWALRLCVGILLKEPVNKSRRGMQCLIEEAALTSVGGRSLQKRLTSLRMQKRILERGINVQQPSDGNAPGLKALVAVYIAATRMNHMYKKRRLY